MQTLVGRIGIVPDLGARAGINSPNVIGYRYIQNAVSDNWRRLDLCCLTCLKGPGECEFANIRRSNRRDISANCRMSALRALRDQALAQTRRRKARTTELTPHREQKSPLEASFLRHPMREASGSNASLVSSRSTALRCSSAMSEDTPKHCAYLRRYISLVVRCARRADSSL